MVRRHRLQLPSNLALLFRTLIMERGVAVRLDPDFVMIDVLAPDAERLFDHPPGWEERAGTAFGLGFAIAAVLGVVLARSIVRPHRC